MSNQKFDEGAFQQLLEAAKEAYLAYEVDKNPVTFERQLNTTHELKCYALGKQYVPITKKHTHALSSIYMYYQTRDTFNFYVSVLSRFKRRSSWDCPTMGVSIQQGSYVLSYNPEWYKYKTVNEVILTLEHEAHHILQDHIPRLLRQYNAVRPQGDLQSASLLDIQTVEDLKAFSNIAADEAVNSLVFHSSWGRTDDVADWINPKDFNHEQGMAYESYLASWTARSGDVYSRKQDGGGQGPQQGEGSGGGGGLGTVISACGCGWQGASPDGQQASQAYSNTTGSTGHTWIDDAASGKGLLPQDEEAAAEAKAQAAANGIPVSDLASSINDLADHLSSEGKRALVSAVNSADNSSKGRGCVPGNYKEMYDDLIEVSKLHWTDILETHISSTRQFSETFKINSINRNRILLGGLNLYGFKDDNPQYTIDVCIDTSGSMSKNDVLEGLGVAKAILQVDSDIAMNLVEFDTKVHRVTAMTPQSEFNTDMWGRGGTDFDAVFIRVRNLPEHEKPDMIIVFTDGGAPPPSMHVRIPESDVAVLWVLTSQGSCDMFIDNNNNYGSIIRTSEYK